MRKWPFCYKEKHLSKAPSGRELSAKLTEGECVPKQFIHPHRHAGSFHRYRGPPPSRREAWAFASRKFVCFS